MLPKSFVNYILLMLKKTVEVWGLEVVVKLGTRACVVCVQSLCLNLKIDIYIQENLWG